MFRETSSPDAAPHPLDAVPACAIIPRTRQRPRVCLANGSVVGHSIQLSRRLPAPDALDRARSIAHDTGALVSVPVGGPLEALPGHVAACLARTGLPPDRLELALDLAAVTRPGAEPLLALAALRDLGVGVALSEFGADMLDLVDRLPVSVLILAPGLLGPVLPSRVPGDAPATTVLHALLHRAHRLGLGVVATGIETEGQRALLSGLGCPAGEGPMFGPATLRRH